MKMRLRNFWERLFYTSLFLGTLLVTTFVIGRILNTPLTHTRQSMKTEESKQPHSKVLVAKTSFYNLSYHRSTDDQIKLKLEFQDKKIFLNSWRSETCNFIK